MQTTTTTTVETVQNQPIVEQSQNLLFPGHPRTLGAPNQDVYRFLEARQRFTPANEAVMDRLSIPGDQISTRENVETFSDSIRQEIGTLADALSTNLVRPDANFVQLGREIINLTPRFNTATEAAFRHFRNQTDTDLVNNAYGFIHSSRVFRSGVIHTSPVDSSEGVITFFRVLGQDFVEFLLPLIQNHPVVRTATLCLILRYLGWLFCYILNKTAITIPELSSIVAVSIERARLRLQITVPRELSSIFTRFRAQISNIQSSWMSQLNTVISQRAMQNLLTFGLGGITTALLGGSLVYSRLNPEMRAAINSTVRSFFRRGGEISNETVFNFRFIWDKGIKVVLKDKNLKK